MGEPPPPPPGGGGGGADHSNAVKTKTRPRVLWKMLAQMAALCAARSPICCWHVTDPFQKRQRERELRFCRTVSYPDPCTAAYAAQQLRPLGTWPCKWPKAALNRCPIIDHRLSCSLGPSPNPRPHPQPRRGGAVGGGGGAGGGGLGDRVGASVVHSSHTLASIPYPRK